MADSNKDATIRAQWSVNAAIAYLSIQPDKKLIILLDGVEKTALEFFNMVDRIVEAGNEVEEAPASEPSVKYLKSLLMQNGRGQLKGKNIDDFLKNNVDQPMTQNAVSELIDKIKTDPKYVSEWLDDIKDYLPTDSGEVYETKEEKAEIEEAKNDR